jgi:hypothetical protein
MMASRRCAKIRLRLVGWYAIAVCAAQVRTTIFNGLAAKTRGEWMVRDCGAILTAT